MQLVGHSQVFKKQVGQRMTVYLSVSKDSTVSTLRDKAVQALKLVDWEIDDSKQYVLLYSDLKTEVEFLLQSTELFTPRKYVELVGTFYSKVRLYLVSKEDWKVILVTNSYYAIACLCVLTMRPGNTRMM